MESVEKIVAAVKARREALKISREKLAVLSGGKLTASWIYKFEKGEVKNPGVESVRVLMDALEKSEQGDQGVS
jgi:transcriptional regulator with XRE-family HTH domain